MDFRKPGEELAPPFSGEDVHPRATTPIQKSNYYHMMKNGLREDKKKGVLIVKAYSRNQVYKTIMILGGVVFSLGLILSAIFKDYQSTLWFVVVGLGFVSQFGKWKKPYAIIDDGNLVLNSGKKEIHFRLPAITITSRTAKKVEFVYNSEKEQKKHTISLANIHKRQRREFLEDLLSAVDHEG